NTTGSLDDWSQSNSMAEVKNLLRLDLEVVVTGVPVFKEATDRRHALKGDSARPHLPHCIGSKEAQHRVKVTAISSLKETARKLDQAGGRGLIGHRLLPQARRLV